MKKKVLITSVCLFILTSWIQIQAQQVDPFYMKLMEQGVKSYLEGRYQDTIEELRIAAFGLGEDKALKGKVHVYLGLAYYYLKNAEECENHLRQADSSFGEEGFNDLEIDRNSRRQLEEILRLFQIGGRKADSIAGLPQAPESREAQPRTIQETPRTPGAKDKTQQPAADPIKQLERQIKNSPKNTSAYYELYDNYREKKDITRARKTLEKLVKNNPAEFNAYHMLGLIHYQTKKYNDAIKNFAKISQLATSVALEEGLRDKARAYLILSTYLKGDRKKAIALASQFDAQFTEKGIDTLGLKTEERARLLKVISDGRDEAEARRLNSRINSLKARIKAKPQDVNLYYELYETYRAINNIKEAKETIQNLVKKNPLEMQGQILLAKLEFRERRYKDVLKSCRKILNAPTTVRTERGMILRATLYATLALNRLGKEKEMETYLRYLQLNVSSEELETILQEEALETEWNKIKSDTD